MKYLKEVAKNGTIAFGSSPEFLENINVLFTDELNQVFQRYQLKQVKKLDNVEKIIETFTVDTQKNVTSYTLQRIEPNGKKPKMEKHLCSYGELMNFDSYSVFLNRKGLALGTIQVPLKLLPDFIDVYEPQSLETREYILDKTIEKGEIYDTITYNVIAKFNGNDIPLVTIHLQLLPIEIAETRFQDGWLDSFNFLLSYTSDKLDPHHSSEAYRMNKEGRYEWKAFSDWNYGNGDWYYPYSRTKESAPLPDTHALFTKNVATDSEDEETTELPFIIEDDKETEIKNFIIEDED